MTAVRLGVVFVLACAACGDDGPTKPVAPRDARPAHVVAAADAEAFAGFVGVITAAESVDIAPRFQGVVASIAVRPGDTVTEGQVIAEMDRKSMEEELRAAEATRSAAIAAERQAHVDVEDARRKVVVETKAVADGISAKIVLEEAQFAYKRAVAAEQRAASAAGEETSHVQTARDHLADLALRAPSDGTVALRFKDPGATVAPGTAIVRIVGRGGVRLKFAVPPEQAQKLATGGVVHATVDTIAKPVPATIRQISPTLDPSSGLIIVEADLGEGAQAPELRPGLAAWVK